MSKSTAPYEGSSLAVFDALREALKTSFDRDRNKLRARFKEWAYKYPGSFVQLEKNPFIERLFEVLDEELDCCLNRDATGKPDPSA